MRKTPLPRGGRLARKTRVKRRNANRRASEFARCYGSKERVEYVKRQPCLYCYWVHPIFAAIERGDSDNAHTVTGGTGWKAGYETIVPLCATHHRKYDEHKKPFDNPETRDLVKSWASLVEAAWQKYQGRTPSAGEPAGARE